MVDIANLEEGKEIKGSLLQSPSQSESRGLRKLKNNGNLFPYPSYNRRKTVLATLLILNKYWPINLSSDRKLKSPTTGNTFSRTEGLLTRARKLLGPGEAEKAAGWRPHSLFKGSDFLVIQTGRSSEKQSWERQPAEKKTGWLLAFLHGRVSFLAQESSRSVGQKISQLSKASLHFPGEVPNRKCQSGRAGAALQLILTPACLGLGYSGKNLLLQGHWGPASNSGGVPKIPGATGAWEMAQTNGGEAEGAAEIRVGREKKALLFLMCLNWHRKEDISSWKPDPEATSLLLWEQLWQLFGDGYIPELRVGNLRNRSSFWL